MAPPLTPARTHLGCFGKTVPVFQGAFRRGNFLSKPLSERLETIAKKVFRKAGKAFENWGFNFRAKAKII